MSSEHRLSATKYIWVALFLGLFVINGNVFLFGQTPVIENVIMAVAMMIAAAGSTVAVWTSQNPFSDDEAESTKPKRGERVKQLIDLLDDDELYELRKRLSTNGTDEPDNYVVLGADGELHSRHQKSG